MSDPMIPNNTSCTTNRGDRTSGDLHQPSAPTSHLRDRQYPFPACSGPCPGPRQFGSDGTASQRWPSGHASAGFSPFAVYFAEWLRHSWVKLSFWPAAFFDILLTLSQTDRGVHFLTYGLWTGLLIRLVNVPLAALLLPRTGR